MKTLRFLLWAFLLVAGFTACSNDFDISIEDINPNDTKSIKKILVGKWKCTDISGGITGKPELPKDYYVEFKSDNTLVTTDNNTQWTCKYSILDNWVKEDGRIIGFIRYGAINFKYKVTITEKKMVLSEWDCYDGYIWVMKRVE